MPDLSSSHRLEELTIQNSNLKKIDSEFCNRKYHLKKMDLSMNNFENLEFTFDKCINVMKFSFKNKINLQKSLKFFR